MKDPVTYDFADFGARERAEAAELLSAMNKGVPADFEDNEVRVAFNMNSGFVFLTNSEYQVAMLNGDVLESFYSCPECGHEGFAEDMGRADGHNLDIRACLDYVRDVAPNELQGWIDAEFDKKAVVIRDGARGWRLSACFVEDALGLLDADEETRAKYVVPSEDDVDYLEIVTDDARTLEDAINEAGYSVAWNDGYVIYKDLSEEAQEALANA